MILLYLFPLDYNSKIHTTGCHQLQTDTLLTDGQTYGHTEWNQYTPPPPNNFFVQGYVINKVLFSEFSWCHLCTDSSNFWYTLQWRHNESYGISNHQHLDCLLNCLFRRRSKHQSSASLAFAKGIQRCLVNSPHKGQSCGKCFHLMTSPWLLHIYSVRD